jgi:predicted O-linked N-acetylglucosamine transferase (SPINDLY family)
MAVNPELIVEQGIALLQKGQLDGAEVLFRQVLAAAPRHLDALQFLGVIAYQKGRFQEATELLEKAVDMAPDAAGLHCNLGLAQQALGRPEQALACYERALFLKPGLVEALNNRGNALRELNRLNEAAASYRRALKARPEFVEALYNLGLTLIAQEKPDEALPHLARCLRVAPNHTGALAQYGIALLALKRSPEALSCFERVLSATPNDAEAHYWRGNALLAQGRPLEALVSYQRAAQIRPDIPEVHYNLANTLLDQGQHEDALIAFERALALRPDYLEALYNLGGTLQEMQRYDEAAATFESLLVRAPGHRYALGKLFHCRQFFAEWANHAKQATALVQAVEAGAPRDIPFSFLSVSSDPALQLRCAQAYTASKFPPSAKQISRGQRSFHDKIRIAYVSADFREHALCYLLAGVFETHDRASFETYGFALKPVDGSAMAQRVVAAFDRFIDVSAMSDTQVAALMRELEIDIAVDLTGYTQDNRTAIFAQHPAPIQVNYLGFPGTMGANYIDYIIADQFVIPESSRPHYAEQIAYLPECFQGNDDQREISLHTPSREEVGLPETGFVFCAFNNTYKLTPAFFDIWMRLLQNVPGSVLWFAADAADLQRNLRTEAAKRGVAPERLIFSPRIKYAEHLARLRLADLFLDTLPFNAGTTASDALWAGVPVLTCTGDAFASRMAGSLLHSVGLPELVTNNIEAYEAKAQHLATTPDALAEIRARLATQRIAAPLFNTGRFCRHLEAAYFQMMARHQRGEAPLTFKLAPLNAGSA